jgi:hypothetical protein
MTADPDPYKTQANFVEIQFKRYWYRNFNSNKMTFLELQLFHCFGYLIRIRNADPNPGANHMRVCIWHLDLTFCFVLRKNEWLACCTYFFFIAEVHEWLEPLLRVPVRPFELYTAPPRTVLAESATLLGKYKKLVFQLTLFSNL